MNRHNFCYSIKQMKHVYNPYMKCSSDNEDKVLQTNIRTNIKTRNLI